MPLVLLVILPWLGSLIAVMLPSNARNAESTAAGVISLAALVQAALYFPAIARGEVIEQRITWLPTLGLDLVLRMDGLAWLFTMLVLDWRAGGALCALLHVAGRSGAALLRLSHVVHGGR